MNNIELFAWMTTAINTEMQTQEEVKPQPQTASQQEKQAKPEANNSNALPPNNASASTI